MLSNHLKVGLRRLARNRTVALINIFGLAIGLTTFLLIACYLHFELTFDQFHRNKDVLYRVGLQRFDNKELIERSAKTFPGIRSLLKEHVPEAEHFTGFYKTPANTGFLFRYHGKMYNEFAGWLHADSAFFQVFPSLLSQGDARTLLSASNSLVLSESMAKRLFGDRDAIGQHLERIDDHTTGTDFVVTGVMKDIPANAHFHALIVQQINDSWPESETNYWDGALYAYVTLANGSEPRLVEEKLNRALKKLEQANPAVKNCTVFLSPVTDIHLDSNLKDELEANGSRSLVYLLGLVGMVILISAWINYVNLETSRFVTSLKAYGIRRIVGSGKVNLAIQFLVEYGLVAIGATALSIFAIVAFGPYFEMLLDAPLISKAQLGMKFWLVLVILVCAGSVLVGIYPALVLMRINPLMSIKGHPTRGQAGVTLRRFFLTFQFSASIVLVGFVWIISRQIAFMSKRDKSIELDQVIAVRNPTAYSSQELPEKFGEFQRFQDRVKSLASVQNIASSSAIPGTEIGFSYVNRIKRNVGDAYDPTVYKTMFVSDQFVPTFGLELLAGQNFSVQRGYSGNEPWESHNWASVILNEQAIRQLGFRSPQAALNQDVYFQPFDDELKCRIIGVLKDYHHEAVKKEIYPTILFHNYGTYQQVYFSVRMSKGTKASSALASIERSWRETFPDRPFDYFFLDEYYDRQFKSETRFHSIFRLFAFTAVFISALGVFGISVFEANARLKEISIRKVLGATATGIVVLLSRNSFRTVLLSTLIGGTTLWLLADRWLSAYPLRIGFSITFLLVPLAVLLVVVLTISVAQGVKAALTNPVNHLRNE